MPLLSFHGTADTWVPFTLTGLAPGTYRVVVIPPAGSTPPRRWHGGVALRTEATPVTIVGPSAVGGIDIDDPSPGE